MLKIVIIFTLFMSLGASPATKRASSPVMPVIELEEACVRQGGLCLSIQDCDPKDLSQIRGVLCPAQKHMGVECCYM